MFRAAIFGIFMSLVVMGCVPYYQDAGYGYPQQGYYYADPDMYVGTSFYPYFYGSHYYQGPAYRGGPEYHGPVFLGGVSVRIGGGERGGRDRGGRGRR
jgi:hypothetical protein